MNNRMIPKDNAVINFIELIEKGESDYKLTSIIPNLFIDAKLKMLDSGNYEVSFVILPEHESKGIDIHYFLKNPFILFAKGQKILIQNIDIIEASETLSQHEVKIILKAFRGDIDDSLWTQSRQTAYVKYNKKEISPYRLGVEFNLSTNNDTNLNALCLNIDGTDLLFYHETTSNKDGYFIFWPKGLIDHDRLRDIIETISIALGLLSGYYMLDSIYYVSQKKSGIEGLTYRYENLTQLINSREPIIDTGIYEDISSEQLTLTSNQFNELVNLLYCNEEYKRSAFLLIEAGNVQGLAKASLGAVALETITNTIVRKTTSKVLIADANLSDSVKSSLNATLTEYKDKLTNEQFKIMNNKLNKINDIPNSDKLLDAFKCVGIELDKKETDCIKSRNLFLHGRLPKKDPFLSEAESLDILSNRLVMLSAMLLLKMSKYEGYIIDRGMTKVIKWRKVRSGELVGGGNYLRLISKKID